MRKFLSILMLACLLCGLALPAGAEGEGGGSTTAKLYAKTGSGEEYLESLTFVTGETLTARFYTSNTAESVAITSGTFTSDKTDLTIGTPGENGNCALSSDVAGDYTVSYELEGTTYSMAVTVTVSTTNTITVPDAATLNAILSDQAAFETFLTENHYSGSGDLTLLLPTGDLEGVVCGVSLSNGASLILKGTANLGTTAQGGLTITVPNVHLDGIKFTGAESVTVYPGCNLAASNCSFEGEGYAFQLKQGADEKVARLKLTDNSYNTDKMASIYNPEGTAVIGKWRAKPGSDSGTVEIDFGVTVVKKETAARTEALHINISSSKAALVNKDWGFSFLTDCDFNDAYTVFSRKKAPSSFVTEDNKKQILIGGQNKGEYIVVNDSYPKLVKKNNYYELTVTDKQKSYLDEVTVDIFPYPAANITLNSKAVDFSIKTASGARSLLIPNLEAGTYTIKETTKTVTKTVTKASTTTTRRSYNYKYQDYYLITPQRVTDCMRYAKDNLVTIECKEAGRRSISLPVASMAAAAEKGYSILLKNEKIADITMDAAALKSMAQQAKGTTVLLHYRSLNHKTLTTVGLASVQSHLDQFPNDNADLAFLLTATSDSETIEDLQLGTITLKIPFIVLPGTEEMKNEVYALQSETSASARETTVADGHLTTRLTDLTEHMVFQIGEPVETTEETTEPTVETTVETTQPETEPETVPETTAAPEPVEEEKGFPVWIPIVAVLLLAGGAASWFLYFRKRFNTDIQ